MRRDRFGDLANTMGLLALQLHRACGDMSTRDVAWKEPVLWFLHSPPSTQDLQEFRREHYIPISSSFTVLDAQDHALAVDGGWGERDGLGNTQTCGIAGGQDGAVFPAPDAVQELKYFLGAEDDG